MSIAPKRSMDWRAANSRRGSRSRTAHSRRVGYLYLHEGEWNGRQILSRDYIRSATKPMDLASFVPYYAFFWGSNGRGTFHGMPGDSYWALGLGDSFVLVCPSLDMVAVRLGTGSVKSQLPGGDLPADWGKRVEGFFRLVAAAAPRVCAIEPGRAPYPPSPVITAVRWVPAESIIRRAEGRRQLADDMGR